MLAVTYYRRSGVEISILKLKFLEFGAFFILNFESRMINLNSMTKMLIVTKMFIIIIMSDFY